MNNTKQFADQAFILEKSIALEDLSRIAFLEKQILHKIKAPFFKKLTENHKANYFLLLLRIYIAQKKFSEHKKLTESLLKNDLYKPFWFSIQCSIALKLIQEECEEKADALIQMLICNLQEDQTTERKEIECLIQKVHRSYFSLLEKADALFRNQHYIEALPLFIKIHQAILQGIFPKNGSYCTRKNLLFAVTYRVAVTQYILGKHTKALDLVKVIKDNPADLLLRDEETQKMTGQSTLLYALLLHSKKAYKEALFYFQKTLENKTPLVRELENAILIESAHCALKIGETNLARSLINTTAFNKTTKKALYQKKNHIEILCHIEQKQHQKAFHIIEESLHSALLDQKKLLFLKAYTFFHLQNFQEAIAITEELLPLLLQETSLYSETFFLKTLAELLFLMKNKPDDLVQQLQRITSCFDMLLSNYPDDRFFIALLSTHYIEYSLTNNPYSLLLLQKKRDEWKNVLQEDTKYTLSLLFKTIEALSSSDLQKPHNHPLFPKVLLDESIMRLSEKSHENFLVLAEENLISEAIQESPNSLYMRSLIEHEMAYDILRKEADSLYPFALRLLEKNFETSLFQEEALFLSTFARFELLKKGHIEKNTTEIQQTVAEFLKNFPESAYAPYITLIQGHLALEENDPEKALNCYKEIIEKELDPHLIEETSYFIIKAEEARPSPKKVIKSLKKAFFTNFPFSPFAAEVFFSYYPEEEYLRQNKQAIMHLKTLPVSFENTLFGLFSNYYIGRYYKKVPTSHEKAISYFQKCLDFSYKEHAAIVNHVQYNALFEIASSLALEGKYTTAMPYIDTLLTKEYFIGEKDLLNEEKKNLWMQTVLLKKSCLEESAAFDQLLDFLEQSIDIYKNYYPQLSLFSIDLHSFFIDALLKKNFSEKALLCVEELTSCKEVQENRIFLLKTLFAKAKCLYAIGKKKSAMHLLAIIINDDAAMSLRIEAMFLRSEIYAKEQKYNHAEKQLLAITKKGGAWAANAKKKLREEYGYRNM